MQQPLSDRSQLIDKLQRSADSRASYIRGKINVLVPAQLHALRLRLGWTQKQFAQAAKMKQSRVSAMEQPGAVNFNMETLIRSAATCGVGLVVRFVPFSEMLRWENNFDQDSFNPTRIGKDRAFLNPAAQTAPIWLSTVEGMMTGTYIGEWSPANMLPAYETLPQERGIDCLVASASGALQNQIAQ